MYSCIENEIQFLHQHSSIPCSHLFLCQDASMSEVLSEIPNLFIILFLFFKFAFNFIVVCCDSCNC